MERFALSINYVEDTKHALKLGFPVKDYYLVIDAKTQIDLIQNSVILIIYKNALLSIPIPKKRFDKLRKRFGYHPINIVGAISQGLKKIKIK